MRQYRLFVRRVHFGHQAHRSMAYEPPDIYDSFEEAEKAREQLMDECMNDAIHPYKVGPDTVYTGKYHYDPNWAHHYPQEYYEFTIIAHDV